MDIRRGRQQLLPFFTNYDFATNGGGNITDRTPAAKDEIWTSAGDDKKYSAER